MTTRYFRAGVSAALLVLAAPAWAQTAQPLPYSQDWTNIGLITTSDDWSGVPGAIGYRGDALVGAIGTSPDTVLTDGSATPVDVNANQTDPNTFNTGGLAEFEIANPSVALNGSGTADAPHLVLRVITSGLQSIRVRYNLRDLDGSPDNSIQPIALQYRVGTTGDFTNVPGGFIADASGGPDQATLVTPVDVTLPAAANNQASVDIRVITTNALGNDEWIGVDDIQITGTISTAQEPGTEAPAAFRLEPAYPNPFNPATTLRFALDAAGPVRLAVFDALGREVAVLAEGTFAAGAHDAAFDAAALPSGAYLVRLEADGRSVTQTVTLVK